MSVSASFVVAAPPRTWMRTAYDPRSRRAHVTPIEQREYQALVAQSWLRDMGDACASWPRDGRYALEVYIVPASKRRADLDNYVKNICDSLNGHAWADDSQVDRITIERCAPNKEQPCTIVRIHVLPANSDTATEGAAARVARGRVA